METEETYTPEVKDREPVLWIYLSGGIEAAPDKGVGWRDTITPWLKERGFYPVNPIDFDKSIEYPDKLVDGKLNYEPVREAFASTVHRDLALVHDCDVVVCLWDEAAANGAGTHGELTFAFKNDIPVIILNKTGTDIPAWIIGCSTYICSSMEELRGFLACIYAREILEHDVVRNEGTIPIDRYNRVIIEETESD